MEPYGYEVIIDVARANVALFNRPNLGKFLDGLCDILEVKPQDRHWWDGDVPPEYKDNPKVVGTTVVQFLLFSNITIHALNLLERVYINIFVCKEFDYDSVIQWAREFFGGETVRVTVIQRS